MKPQNSRRAWFAAHRASARGPQDNKREPQSQQAPSNTLPESDETPKITPEQWDYIFTPRTKTNPYVPSFSRHMAAEAITKCLEESKDDYQSFVTNLRQAQEHLSEKGLRLGFTPDKDQSRVVTFAAWILVETLEVLAGNAAPEAGTYPDQTQLDNWQELLEIPIDPENDSPHINESTRQIAREIIDRCRSEVQGDLEALIEALRTEYDQLSNKVFRLELAKQGLLAREYGWSAYLLDSVIEALDERLELIQETQQARMSVVIRLLEREARVQKMADDIVGQVELEIEELGLEGPGEVSAFVFTASRSPRYEAELYHARARGCHDHQSQERLDAIFKGEAYERAAKRLEDLALSFLRLNSGMITEDEFCAV